MIIGGITNLTLLDYPEKVACAVFTVGCNFRCPFCHNSTLVCGNDGKQLSVVEVLRFLQKRRNVLEGMCLTGGEPLIQNGVEEFLQAVKALGYSVKLDTNGSYPERLKSLVTKGLVDYVAMDVKNSKDKYVVTAGCNDSDLDKIQQSIDYLKSGVVDYEFRTTVTGNLHTEQSIGDMACWLAGAKRLYLQKFVNSGDLIDMNTIGCDDDTMKRYLDVVRKYVPNAELRGM